MNLRAWTLWAIGLFIAVCPSITPADEPAKINEFTFMIGPYPTKGVFEYHLDAGQIRQVYPSAASWVLVVDRDGQRIKSQTDTLPVNGVVKGFIDVGAMPDGAKYTLGAIVRDDKNQGLVRQEKTFTRQVQPFETAPQVGLSDIIVPPFTAPVLAGDDASVWGRTYHHSADGLMGQITAADKPLLAAPARFRVRIGDEPLTALTGSAPELTSDGPNRINYAQSFSAQGLKLTVHGVLDYDGFYRFSVTMAPEADQLLIHELRLDIPFRNDIAQLLEAAVTWRRNHGPQKEVMGVVDPKQGLLWDSHTFPSRVGDRIGNMPPFFWIGDDDRGLTWSNASEQGMHNDENKAAAQLERQEDQVIYTVWFVNSDLQLTTPRTFEFALQASPFKAMPDNARLWRNVLARMPYRNGILFTNWFTDGSYPTYGRFLTLELLKKYADSTGADQVGVMASAVSECGGTPEYLQFWHEWGSDLYWPLLKRGAPDDWAVKMMEEANLPVNPYIRVESSSNVSSTNVQYRTWWFDQEVKHSNISYIYQDNPPYVYYYDPPSGYGYTRDDGRHESTSAIWNSRDFAKRIATIAIDNGKTESPYLWVNAISTMLPGRSFARKMLNGEYLYTKLLTLGQIRVMASKQWGMVLDWYPFPQTEESPYPNVGPVRKYWREVFSRLLLHDITNISGSDDAGYTENWFNALDLFWLDDPTVQWHPYYRNDTQPVTVNQSTYVSTYTAKDRALWFISNQSPEDVVESVRSDNLAPFATGQLRHFYDAETGERIEVGNGRALKLFIPAFDYRIVIGLPSAWEYAAGNGIEGYSLGLGEIAAQSTIDARQTLNAISQQLLTSSTLRPIPRAHKLYERWMQQVLAELASDADRVQYYNAGAMADIDFGQPGIKCSVFFDKKRDALLVNYYNESDEDVSLPQKVREQIAAKVGKGGHNFIIHPVYGNSEWAFIDIPAKSGLLEIYYSNSEDFWGPRRGPYKAGTMLGNMRHVLDLKQQAMGGRPLAK